MPEERTAAPPPPPPPSLFKADGTRKLRKKRQTRRITTMGNGARRVQFDRKLSVAVRDVDN